MTRRADCLTDCVGPDCEGCGRFTPKSLQQRLNALAALPQFDGTAVRVKCPDEECQRREHMISWTGAPYLPDGDTRLIPCPDCHGAGFTGSRDMAVLMDVARDDWNISFSRVPKGETDYGRGRYTCQLSDGKVILVGLGNSHLEAVVSALEKFLEVKHA